MGETTMLALRALPVRDLRPDRANIRRDMGDLDELGRSMVSQGVLQPLLVQQPQQGVFKVTEGHRRLAAAQRFGIQTLPCLIVARKTDTLAALTMLAAAMHKQLTPVEQAAAFTRLVETQGLSVADIAQATGYSPATVRARMSLDALPQEIKQQVAEKTLGLTAATDLARQVKTRRSGSVVNDRAKSPFGAQHPLARSVAQSCTHKNTRVLLGRIGCGQCWEAAIRADERSRQPGLSVVRETQAAAS